MTLRKKATLTFWIALVFCLAVMVFSTVAFSGKGKLFGTLKLIRAADATMNAFQSFNRARLHELSSFIPPTDVAVRSAWAGRIQQHLGQPVSVFLAEGSRIDWINKPDQFAKAAEYFTPILRKHPLRTGGYTMDTLGAMFFCTRNFAGEDSVSIVLWQVGLQDDSLSWGVVIHGYDSWRVFLENLKTASGNTPTEEAKAVRSFLQLSGPGPKSLGIGFRALIDGETIFSSPGLDTTRLSIKHHYSHLWLEYYTNSAFMFWELPGYFSLRIALITSLVMMAVLCIMYFWIRKLTAPA